MDSRTLVTLAAFCAGLSLAAAPAARADGPGAEHPLSTAWLSASPLLPEPLDAPACRPDGPAERAAGARTAAKIAEIRALLAAEAARSPETPEGFMVLNNRGYNYGASAVVDPSLVEFEARRLAR
jgi:hypothetical protein